MDNGSFSAPGSSGAPLPPPTTPPPASLPPSSSPLRPIAPYGSAPPFADTYGAPLPPAPKRRGLPSWAIAVISVVGIGGLAAAVLAAQSSSTHKAEVEFDEDFREEFIDGCLGAGPAATRDVCGCYYDELVKRMSAEEMIRLGLDDSADAGEDPRVVAAVEQCI